MTEPVMLVFYTWATSAMVDKVMAELGMLGYTDYERISLSNGVTLIAAEIHLQHGVMLMMKHPGIRTMEPNETCEVMSR